jgi:hypothetical protein
MTTHDDVDAPERLDREELNLLKAQLELVGVGWSYGRGLHGIHTASRRATQPQQQASLSAEGLLAAVEQREAQLSSLEPHRVEVHDGVESSH